MGIRLKRTYIVISEELALKIVSLALDTDPSTIDSVLVSFYPFPFDRYTKAADVFASISVFEEEDIKTQFMIMRNGDLHARNCPYYDGDRLGLLMIHNQAKIQQLIHPLINPKPWLITYKQVHGEIKEAFYRAPLGLKHLPAEVKEVILPAGYEAVFKNQYMDSIGIPPEVLTYRGVTMRTVESAICIVVQAKDPAINAYYQK